jgi:hypothetical protein
MTEYELEEFEAAASNYRAWPAQDIAGVAARFAELIAVVDKMIERAYGDGDERDDD